FTRTRAASGQPVPLLLRPVGTFLSPGGWSTLAAAGILVAFLIGKANTTRAPQWTQQRDLQSAEYHTAAGQTRSYQLPDGSLALLLPNTTVRYDAHILKDQLVLDIEGSAQIDVAADVKPVQVRKVTGYAELAPGGRYTINSLATSSRLLVTVVRGSAEMLNAAGTSRVAVSPGNVGQFMPDGGIRVFAALATPPDRSHQ
ncbi:MAG TPA: FecR domain-containing protein, partial [Gemmatimonadaceae bacterium]